MKLPTDLFLSSISEKKVYYFSTNKINTQDPHYFICIKRTNNDILIMSCCTSQYDTVRHYVENSNLPYETLVWITPLDESNPFNKNTYINCNYPISFTVDEFRSKYESDSVTFSGEISNSHYNQILIGLHSSPMIDLETKELLPDPDTIYNIDSAMNSITAIR